MSTIRIDEEVWRLLKRAAVPLEDEPNDALRRLLGLPDRNSGPKPDPAAVLATRTAAIGNGGSSPHGTRFDRTRIEETICEIIRSCGGQIAVKDPISGFNIYEEVADRLSVPRAVRKELTPGGETRWRAEVGYARKNLEQRGVIAPTSQSGRGVWKLL